MIQTILFDLGNVIVPCDYSRAYQKLEECSGTSGDEISKLVFASEIYRKFEMGITSIKEFYLEVKQAINLEMNEEEFRQVWGDIFLPDALLPDELLDSLAARYKLIALSDNNPLHFPIVSEKFSLHRWFDDFVLSYLVGAVKPTKEIFLFALEKAGCDASQCFFIDDVERNVLGAKAVGIEGHQFKSHEGLLDAFRQSNIAF